MIRDTRVAVKVKGKVSVRRKRERIKKFMDMLRKDMKIVGVREEDAEDGGKWRRMICCGES